MANLQGTKDDLVKSAKATTIFMLIGLSAALAAGSVVFIAFDLIASFMSWGKEMAYQVDLPYQDALSVALTLMPTLVQLAYVAAGIAGLPFTKNRAFKTLFIGSLLIDTLLDTIQMNKGTPESLMFSVFVSVFVFAILSEFLFIFSASVLVSLILKLKNDTGLMDMALDEMDGGNRSKPRGGQNRGRGN